MDYRRIITIEPGKRGGKPCIRGLRITVYDVLEYLASGMTEERVAPERHGCSVTELPPTARSSPLSRLSISRY